MKNSILIICSLFIITSCGSQTPLEEVSPNDSAVLQQLSDDYKAIIESGDGTDQSVKSKHTN